MDIIHQASVRRVPWNKGKLVGQKAPLKQREIWGIRIRLHLTKRTRELALFNLAVDSKLRSCDLVRLRVRDVTHGDQVANRAIVMQQKTRRPVQFEITEQTRESIAAWIRCAGRRPEDYLSPSRVRAPHLSTRQYARIVRGWVREIVTEPGRIWNSHVARFDSPIPAVSSNGRCFRNRRAAYGRVGDTYRLIRVAGAPDHDKEQNRSKQQPERANDRRQHRPSAQCEVQAEQRDGCG